MGAGRPFRHLDGPGGDGGGLGHGRQECSQGEKPLRQMLGALPMLGLELGERRAEGAIGVEVELRRDGVDIWMVIK